MLRDPHETIVRNVLIIPADGGEPRITPMTFSEEGARANPHAFYTIGVDLRGLYGERNMHATRTKGGDVTNQPEKIVEGEYDLFFNISPKLPANVTMARIVGADPKRPGDRPLWRGDVVLVKTTEWPAPMPPGGGNHMDYLDVPPQAIELFTCHMIPNWYQSDQWGNFLKTEREYNATSWKQSWTPFWSNNPEKDRKKYGKTARMLDRLEATRSCYPVPILVPKLMMSSARDEKHPATEFGQHSRLRPLQSFQRRIPCRTFTSLFGLPK
ncbi:hypothetical protein B0H11DRAFT_2008701 [Mycena galericulata]|nr:hypothetical protein B0H11DRAFT_2008701 [Mycena galericulata]